MGHCGPNGYFVSATLASKNGIEPGGSQINLKLRHTKLKRCEKSALENFEWRKT
jgi:hypothetical protein